MHSVAAQLVQAPQLTAYRDLVLRSPALQTILAQRSCVSDPAAALLRGVLEPLSSLRRAGKLAAQTCLLVVDALCEAEYHKPGEWRISPVSWVGQRCFAMILSLMVYELVPVNFYWCKNSKGLMR